MHDVYVEKKKTKVFLIDAIILIVNAILHAKELKLKKKRHSLSAGTNISQNK